MADLEENVARARLAAEMFDEPFEPVRVGRFALLRRVGAGAMGVVHAGYDDTLDRKVAIKLINPTIAVSEHARGRMLREAQALAKVSHANVVAVYEAGLHEDSLFIAMEFVQGATLREWAQADRSWREVLEAYLQAGRGLAAVHAAGLVHRDFKPDNAMVDDAGHVRVMDFGLARVGASRDDAGRSASSESAPPDGSQPLTQTGALVGTPAYMAPEQLDGEEADALSDQYSFCVALWEGLFGKRPFRADSLAELLDERRKPPEPVAGSGVRRSVIRALTRGLSAEPGDRFADMKGLLAALDAGSQQRRRRWVGVAALAALAAGGGALWSTARAQPCTDAERHLAGVWDADRRAEAEAAVLDVDVPYAARVWEHVGEDLDAYATEWVEMHAAACEATAVHREQSEAVLDLRMRCLRRAKVQLDAAVGVLIEADETVVLNARRMTDGLAPVARCADVDTLGSGREPPSPAEAAAVSSADELLDEASVELSVGRPANAEAKVREAEALIDGLSYPDVQVELAYWKGHVEGALGRYRQAEAEFRRAVGGAVEARRNDLLADASRSLISVVGELQLRPDAALVFRELAEGAARGDRWREAALARIVGGTLTQAGEYDEAEATLLRAMALSRGHPRGERAIGKLHFTMAILYFDRGRYADAEGENREALKFEIAENGPVHPMVALAHNNLGNALGIQGRFAEAERELRRALEIRQELLEPGHPDIGQTQRNLANVLGYAGRLDEAEELIRDAVSALEVSFRPGHPELARSRQVLAGLLTLQQRHGEAVQMAREVVEALVAESGRTHPKTLEAREWLADSLMNAGELDAAAEQSLILLTDIEAHVGPLPARATAAHGTLAQVRLEQGRYAEALEAAEKAQAVLADGLEDPLFASQVKFILARALWEAAPEQRERARALAQEVLTTAEQGRPVDPTLPGPIARWLDEHPLD